jgi:uncharacterized surface protein with fasciclin (FAS1) repeats
MVIAGSAQFTAAQSDTTGSLRITQMVYPDADDFLDGALLFALAFPLTSDSLVLNPGPHTLVVAPSGAGIGAGVSADLDIQAGHDYAVATIGEFDGDSASLLVIDKTADLMGQTDHGSYVLMLHNVSDAPAVDVYFNDELVGANMAFGGYVFASVPAGQIDSYATLIGQPFVRVFQSPYLVIPNSTGQASLAGTFSLFTALYETFDYQRYALRTSDLNTLDFLAGYITVEGNDLNTFMELVQAAGLADLLSGADPVTVFAPTDAAFAALPPVTLDALRADPAALANLLRAHIVPGNFPAYKLGGDQTLTAAQGSTISSAHTPGKSFRLNDTIGVGLENQTSNGVVYLIDTVLLPIE